MRAVWFRAFQALAHSPTASCWVIGPVVSGSRLPAFLPVELSVAWSLFWVWHVADPPTEKNHMVPPGCWGRESVDPFQCSEDRCICITASMCRGKHCVLKTLLCIFSFFYLLFRWITSRERRESIVPRRMGCQKEKGSYEIELLLSQKTWGLVGVNWGELPWWASGLEIILPFVTHWGHI